MHDIKVDIARVLASFDGEVRLFPLPNLVLFPDAFAPLKVFEDRYVRLVEDAVEDDGLVALALLEDGWETAREHGLLPSDELARDGWDAREPHGRGPNPHPRAMIESWLRLTASVNDLSAGLGTEPLYPFAPAGPALDKIVFVHDAISRQAVLDRA